MQVTAYNISTAQIEYAREKCKGLPVEFRLQDYREATGVFDKVVAIGLCEHVGYKNYRSFLELAYRCLKPGGIFLLHTIGRNRSVTHTDPWIDRYIFPGGMLPSVAQLGQAMDDLFVLEDWHSFGTDYDRTLMAWHANFEKAWPRFSEEYGERVLPHVAVLPPVLCGRVSQPADPALAVGACKGRHPRRMERGPVTKANPPPELR